MVSVRAATPDDAGAIRSIYAPFIEQTAITFHTVVESVEDYRSMIDTGLREYPWYVAVDDDGQIVGYAHASQHHPRQAYRWSVNATIYLRADCHGQGIGRRLYAQLFATLKRQGFRMVHAGITMPNEASRRIHESFGFTYVGTFPAAGFKLGVWKDVGWWVLDLMPHLAADEAAAEPIPFAELGEQEYDTQGDRA